MKRCINNCIIMLVLIFLSAFAIASGHEFQLQLERPIQWFPYRSPSPQNYHEQLIPIQYDANLFRYGNTFAEQPTPHHHHHQLKDYVGDSQGRNSNNRIKETLEKSNNAQLRYPFGSHYYWKVATVTTTTTLNITSVYSCIPFNMFAANSYSVICTRRKRDIAQDFLDVDPSEPQQVTMTTVPIVDDQLERGYRRLEYNIDLISSSKDDVIVNDDMTREQRDSTNKHNRYLFSHWVKFVTIPTYVVNTFVVTKKVSPVANLQLYCRPSDYPLCT